MTPQTGITTTAATADKHFLVLNTRTTLKAIKVDPIGNVFKNFEFGFGPETEVWESCSVIINNTMIVFGGANHETQVCH